MISRYWNISKSAIVKRQRKAVTYIIKVFILIYKLIPLYHHSLEDSPWRGNDYGHCQSVQAKVPIKTEEEDTICSGFSLDKNWERYQLHIMIVDLIATQQTIVLIKLDCYKIMKINFICIFYYLSYVTLVDYISLRCELIKLINF